VNLLILKLLFGFLFLFLFLRPTFAQETFYFQEEFNQERAAGILDSNKWVVYPNQPTAPTPQGCLVETVRETAGLLLLKQCPGVKQFPYIVSKNNPIPNGDFTTIVRFQFPGAGGLPTGVKFIDTAPVNGSGATELFGIGFEEDLFQRFVIEYKDNVVFTKGTDSAFYIFKAVKEGNTYKLFLNDQLIFTSPETSEKVKAIYMGNPSILQSAGFSWSWPRIDYIRVANDGPSETIPQPFLDLPWDYMGNEMTFNEAATSINAYFDHQYPFLSSSLSEPEELISFRGGSARPDLDYSSHDGYDYGSKAQTKLNTPVLAPAEGEASFMSMKTCAPCGNAILIDHKNGFQTRYYHLQPDDLIVSEEGQKITVTRGQQIGKVGYSGHVMPEGETGSHLHFMVVQDKNNDGNFSDNIPDGLVDPFGWQSSEPDPWENYSFNYTGQQRTGNKSYYLFTKQLDNLNADLTSNSAVFNVGKTKLEFPQGSTNETLKLVAKSEPNFTGDLLNSLGSIINIVAKTQSGNPITSFLTNFVLKIDFSQFDLSRYNLETLAIYSSQDGENWTKENTNIDFNTKTASASLNHLTYFALMAQRKDTVAPTTTAILEGQKGTGNNFRSDVKVNLNALDNPDGLGVEFTAYGFEGEDWKSYNTPLTFSNEGNYKILFYSQDRDENIEEVKSVEFSIDKTLPVVNINSPQENTAYVLGQNVLAEFVCSDQKSGLQSCQGTVNSGEKINTQSVGEKIFKVEAFDLAGNQTSEQFSYKVQYPNTGLCLGEAGHVILQPINSNGSSIFKQGSTIPAKFRVCDDKGVSVSDANLVTSFSLIKTVSGTTATNINESVISTTPDPNFRYDPTIQQWIFNMNTKTLSPGKTYFYKILLNDFSDIQFSFGLR
jgi:murein DD-endopeptidase MepM/ murein hydrolase activator NlpD